jgi:type IX secretion system PorP/SprF family membrane protein
MKTNLSIVMRVSLLLAWIVAFAATVTAQQDALYTQFFSNQLIVNPAYAGSRDAISLTAFYRNQWTGFPGAPTTTTASIHAPVFKGTSGAGLSLQHDKLGITTTSSLSSAYAYRIDFGKARLALGINGELRLRQMDWAKANPLDPMDPSIAYTNRSLFLPNVGAGIFLDADHYFLGISIPRLLENDLNYVSPGQQAEHLAQLKRHFYVSGGLALRLSDGLVFRPQALVKYVAGAPLQVDLNVGFVMKDKLWVGGTYRTHDSMDFFVQYSVNPKIRFGYAFDYAFTQLSRYNAGTHELMIGLDLGKNRNGFFHPRYF